MINRKEEIFMNEKEMKKFEKNVGMVVSGADVKNNELELTFNEKVLFVTKKRAYKFIANEDIGSVALGCVLNAKMTKFNWDGSRINFTFECADKPVYNLSFKTSKISL